MLKIEQRVMLMVKFIKTVNIFQLNQSQIKVVFARKDIQVRQTVLNFSYNFSFTILGDNDPPFCATPNRKYCSPLFYHRYSVTANCAPVYYSTQSLFDGCSVSDRCREFINSEKFNLRIQFSFLFEKILAIKLSKTMTTMTTKPKRKQVIHKKWIRNLISATILHV